MNGITYLSLGSNLGNREQNLEEAVRRASTLGRVVAVSSFYETEPVEVTDQPWFLNCVLALETTAEPAQLMRELLRIEHEMGRQRLVKKGPRSIDIDILLFGNAVVNTPDLTIPHPEMTRRRFVLEPLAEIAPELLHPVSQKTVTRLLAELAPGQRVQKYEPGIRAE
ncbi:MAG: 2-amino-4-hydroxy-6-hydroxymethyldihydropteridine diphosphokinase [Acidobacteriota bacterium]|jgi:2-amino-4-hydroxy-6-hydroxymethyldihydropteridine diphosphokinase